MAMRFKNILVAADGSDGANRAIDVAAALAKMAGAQLSIVYVVTSNPGPSGPDFERIEHNRPDPAKVLAQSILSDAQQRAGSMDVTSKSIMVQGDPAEAIVNMATNEHADAVVVGRRGRAPITSLLLGSVSQKLVSLSPCVVVVVP
jgi:nucleotide-binding universal stress UspA family protein